MWCGRKSREETAATWVLCCEGHYDGTPGNSVSAANNILGPPFADFVSKVGAGHMSENKRIVERYLDGFRKSDHEQIVACLTDDIEWDMPGRFHLAGKPAFDNEIENDAFEGRPTITITRMVE